MKIVLIRHTSVDVAKGTCYGQSDVPVAATFAEEADQTRDRLAAYEPFDAVYASPLTRTRLLAAHCGYPSPRLDNRLKEMYMGRWEMQRYDDIDDPYLQEWYNDYLHLPTAGGESFPMLYERVASFLDELKTSDYRRVAVFCHAGVIVSAKLYAGLCSQQDAWKSLVEFGGIQEISI